MEMTIRPSKEEDLPRILILLQEIASLHQKQRPDVFKANASKYQKEDLQTLLNDAKSPIFVAENLQNHMVVGYAMCCIQEECNHDLLCDQKVLFVDDLCVDSSLRGMGIGNMLMEHVIAFAKQNHCQRMELYVWECNQKAMAFYEHFGMTTQKRKLEIIT